jgi:hypothetical protein
VTPHSADRQKSTPQSAAGWGVVRVNFCRVGVVRGELLPGRRCPG